jgi:hypothetical protein
MITADVLLEKIRNSGTLNNVKGQGNGDDALLGFVENEITEKIVPALLRSRQSYLEVSSRIPFTAGQTKYRIPERAWAQKLSDIAYVDSNSQRSDFGTETVARDELYRYANSGGPTPSGFYLEGPYIQAVPTSGTYTGMIELSWYMRPSRLVLAAECRKIVGISSGQLTLESTTPTSWTSALLYDIQSGKSGGELKAYDLTASAVGIPDQGTPPVTDRTKILFSSTAIDGSTYGSFPVSVGDYVCLAGECVQPMIPEDLVPQLIEAVCLRASTRDKDPKAIEAGRARLREGIHDALVGMQDRVESKPRRMSMHGSPLFPR